MSRATAIALNSIPGTMIHLIRHRATATQIEEMLELGGLYIKLAVDVEQEILVGGGALHADCERILLEDGSEQRHIWGANWYPLPQSLDYESLINIRPRQNNRSMIIQDLALQRQIEQVVQRLLGAA